MERDIAIMEGEMNHSEDEYFKARPQIDTGHCRHLFQAGFERAWQAARAQPAQQRSVPEGWLELVRCAQSLKRRHSLSEDAAINVGLWKQDQDTPSFHAAFTFTVKDFIATTPQPEGGPDAYCVIEQDGRIGYTVMVREDGISQEQAEQTARRFCHDHINDCAGHGVEGAGEWVVRPLSIGGLKRPQPPQEGE